MQIMPSRVPFPIISLTAMRCPSSSRLAKTYSSLKHPRDAPSPLYSYLRSDASFESNAALCRRSPTMIDKGPCPPLLLSGLVALSQ